MVQDIEVLREKEDTFLIDDTISERYATDQDFAKRVDELYIEFCKRIEELDAKQNK